MRVSLRLGFIRSVKEATPTLTTFTNAAITRPHPPQPAPSARPSYPLLWTNTKKSRPYHTVGFKN